MKVKSLKGVGGPHLNLVAKPMFASCAFLDTAASKYRMEAAVFVFLIFQAHSSMHYWGKVCFALKPTLVNRKSPLIV